MNRITARYLLVVVLLAPLISPFPARHTGAREYVACNAPSTSSVSLSRSSPEQQGISSSDILAFVEAADKEIDTMNSFMLVRHGKVVAEGWWAPYDRDTPHILYSLSKAHSTAVGLQLRTGN